jgi:hypothetical protein
MYSTRKDAITIKSVYFYDNAANRRNMLQKSESEDVLKPEIVFFGMTTFSILFVTFKLAEVTPIMITRRPIMISARY